MTEQEILAIIAQGITDGTDLDCTPEAQAREVLRQLRAAGVFAQAKAAGMRRAAEICGIVRARIACGPMPEGARFDYEQAILVDILDGASEAPQ